MPRSSDELLVCTCSMPSDVPFFRTLAHSIDKHIDPSVKHLVIVPGSATAAFKEFENQRRTIVAQEDVLPFRLHKTPDFLTLLKAFSPAFRRPIYFDSRLKVIRGWIVQQMIKLEISRNASERAVMHVDSDVCFVRQFEAREAFIDGKPMLFRVPNDIGRERIKTWHVNAAKLLGIDPASVPTCLYVGNCIVWDPYVCADMIERIETCQERPIHECVAELSAFSEYVLYGVFATETDARMRVTPRAMTPCFSFWEGLPEAESAADIVAKMQPEHAAVALQSTFTSSPHQRETFFKEIERELSGSPA